MNNLSSKYKWFDNKLEKRLKDALKVLRNAKDNLSEDRVSYLLIATTIGDILHDWNKCNNKDFRFKLKDGEK